MKNFIKIMALACLLSQGLEGCSTNHVQIAEADMQTSSGTIKPDYLALLHNAQKAAATPATIGPGGGPNPLEQLATFYSWLGETEEALNTFDYRARQFKIPKLAQVDNETLKALKAEDAIHAIVSEARNRQIVILNEAHHVPMHRAFAMRLARELRKIGYEYLACETFGSDVNLVSNGATRSDGYYLSEPIFGEFVRDSLRQGWKLIGYEAISTDASLQPNERIKQREIGQAQNLVNKVFGSNPNAKLFVYVGYAHGDKRGAGNPTARKLMGGFLKELSGRDPLSIDQVNLMAHTDQADEKTSYRQIVQELNIDSPAVLKTVDGKPFLYGTLGSVFDMQVVHPPYKKTSGRPAWLVTLAQREAINLPVEISLGNKERAVYAFYQDDNAADAIPVDAVLLQPGKPRPSLMLPKGRFKLLIEE